MIKGTVKIEDSNITSLPDGFSVEGDLKLYCCRQLTSLGSGITVGGCLHIISCEALTTLPADLSVGEHVTWDRYFHGSG